MSYETKGQDLRYGAHTACVPEIPTHLPVLYSFVEAFAESNYEAAGLLSRIEASLNNIASFPSAAQDKAVEKATSFIGRAEQNMTVLRYNNDRLRSIATQLEALV